ncbi:hypothetical protein PDIG_05560 [Penicillium digitatum PHI26]|uniref:Uncharacterized protein n=2 Tax=Penicillium digitatum TaxID=36651 RepID=K9GD67_PEND2|nr:hypothetical protein PDIP_10230 [Penicillium digitatum Pd1]EKV19059.1 hypothetical protein PDIG_05560 [Penicillium digitatum PHI26]EKV21069.1 hypothetical protein PDIP_10230 [Penicillium digitatum Pd1]
MEKRQLYSTGKLQPVSKTKLITCAFFVTWTCAIQLSYNMLNKSRIG